jgi:chorismate synthase
MGSVFGQNFKISLFGESHGAAVGAVMDNFPAGFKIGVDGLTAFMARRKPGGLYATKRKEDDEFEFLSGVVYENGAPVTTGAPLTAIIRNTDTRSKDYSKFYDIPRPSHSDYPAYVKYGGFNDIRGGGHFSARVTAPLTLMGGICKQYLEGKGIKICAHISSIKNIGDGTLKNTGYRDMSDKDFPVLDYGAGVYMRDVIEKASANSDSVGGTIECGIFGMPPGIGDPFFNSVESVISHLIFSIPAVKGSEFGAGFAVSQKYGSENNDCYVLDGEKGSAGAVITKTNNAGGINGGLSTGMPIIFKAAFKPTPSIYKGQKTLNVKTGKEETLKIEGRHDPCVVVRAVPVVEAAAAVGVMSFEF